MKYGSIACGLVLLGHAYIAYSSSVEQELTALEEQLWQAVESDDEDEAASLLQQGVDPNIKRKDFLGDQETPLMHAVGKSNFDMAGLLLGRGAQPLTPLELTRLHSELYGIGQDTIVTKRQKVMESLSQWLKQQDTKHGVAITPELETLIHQYLGTPEKTLPKKLAPRNRLKWRGLHNEVKKRRRFN